MTPPAIFTVFIVSSFIAISVSTRYCLRDLDCSDLGELTCQRSMCEWGICGCKRGYAARFIGNRRIFRCVKLKRVGDFCSHNLDVGVCAANNSFCDEGVCRCTNGTVSRFHGEVCLPELAGYPSESSTDSMSRHCVSRVRSAAGPTSHIYREAEVLSPMNSLAPHCDCPAGYQSVISQDLSDSAFFSSKVPICQMRRIDNELDKCITHSDCPQTGGSQVDCDDFFVCRCALRGHVRNFEANKCGLPLSFGEVCTKARLPLLNHVCDGTLGLICGDPCDMKRQESADEDICVCAPSYMTYQLTNGSYLCIEKQIGDTCYGDFNCRSPLLGNLAYCNSNGKCQNAANRLKNISAVLDLVLLLLWPSIWF